VKGEVPGQEVTDGGEIPSQKRKESPGGRRSCKKNRSHEQEEANRGRLGSETRASSVKEKGGKM